MCYSLADGGQRCASHTRNAYVRAQRMVDDLYKASDLPRHDESAWDARAEALDNAAVAYASTDEGRAKFTQDILDAESDQDFARLNNILQRGQAMREANAEIREQIRYRRRTVADRIAGRPARERDPADQERQLALMHRFGYMGRLGD